MTQRRRASFFAREARQRGDIETDNTTARLQQGSLETGITSAPENCTKNAHFSPAKAMTVSIPRERERAKVTAVSDKALPAPAKAMAVSDNRPSWPTGPGGGTHGRWRGLAGLRDDAPSEARSADGERAGRRTPAHTAAGPDGARNTSGTTQPPGYAKGAGTEVPAPLSTHSATASSRLRPNNPQSWRRRRIHRNMPPTTAAPRPAPPIRPSKPVRARR